MNLQNDGIDKLLRALDEYCREYDAYEFGIPLGFTNDLENKEEATEPRLREIVRNWIELLPEIKELKRLAHRGLPDDCIQEWGNVKFCSYRNGDGNQCKMCSDLNNNQ